MVIYVKLEPDEKRFLRDSAQELKSSAAAFQLKAADFNKIRLRKRASVVSLDSKTKSLRQELANIIVLLPEIEKKQKAKPMPIKETIKPEEKLLQPAKKKSYKEELEEIRKRIQQV